MGEVLPLGESGVTVLHRSSVNCGEFKVIKTKFNKCISLGGMTKAIVALAQVQRFGQKQQMARACVTLEVCITKLKSL